MRTVRCSGRLGGGGGVFLWGCLQGGGGCLPREKLRGSRGTMSSGDMVTTPCEQTDRRD